MSKDKIWVLLKCGYVPNGKIIYDFIIRNHRRIERLRSGKMSKVRSFLSTPKYDVDYKKLSSKYSIYKSHPMFRIVEIETINRCNGKCAFCPVNAMEPQRPYAKMTSELFSKIIDELASYDYDGMISLYSNNEPLLDERIVDFSKEARSKVPKAYINLSTNGSMLTIDKVSALYPYLDECTIDNYSDNSEINSNLVGVMSYINAKRYDDVFHFVMRDRQAVLTTRGGNAPNRRDERIKTIKHGCFYPFIQMVIRPNGKCSLCCNDALGKYTMGNVNNQSLKEIWCGKKYEDLRVNMKRYGRARFKLCKYCDSMFNAWAFERARNHKKC